MKKALDLLWISFIYILSYCVGFLCVLEVDNLVLRCFIFDSVATVVVFAFSVIHKNSSVYDPYWSLTPFVITIYLFVIKKSFGMFALIFLIFFAFWSFRLTINWITVFSGFSYEDWRYRKFRDETPKLLWPVVNFFGIHYMPTLIVFLCMLPIFCVIEGHVGILSVPGFLIMLLGIVLELFADKQMHRFLNSKEKNDVCKIGVWKYSRHPNYLGEITFWTGIYIAVLPYSLDYWFYCIGFISVFVMFNVVSIPLMEKRQLSKRLNYKEYCESTSRLFFIKCK